LLDDAVAAFLSRVSERSFDEPFMALLRAEGYTEVRLVHGQVEFGKDIIARKNGEQWVFQSKAGDLNLAGFRPVRDQLYELRMSDLSAPGFDKNLPRRAVLVQTGRMTGQAPVAAQEYEQQCIDRGEAPIEFWNQDALLAKLSGKPDAVLRGSMDGQLFSLLGPSTTGQPTWTRSRCSRAGGQPGSPRASQGWASLRPRWSASD